MCLAKRSEYALDSTQPFPRLVQAAAMPRGRQIVSANYLRLRQSDWVRARGHTPRCSPRASRPSAQVHPQLPCLRLPYIARYVVQNQCTGAGLLGPTRAIPIPFRQDARYTSPTSPNRQSQRRMSLPTRRYPPMYKVAECFGHSALVSKNSRPPSTAWMSWQCANICMYTLSMNALQLPPDAITASDVYNAYLCLASNLGSLVAVEVEVRWVGL